MRISDWSSDVCPSDLLDGIRSGDIGSYRSGTRSGRHGVYAPRPACQLPKDRFRDPWPVDERLETQRHGAMAWQRWPHPDANLPPPAQTVGRRRGLWQLPTTAPGTLSARPPGPLVARLQIGRAHV